MFVPWSPWVVDCGQQRACWCREDVRALNAPTKGKSVAFSLVSAGVPKFPGQSPAQSLDSFRAMVSLAGPTHVAPT